MKIKLTVIFILLCTIPLIGVLEQPKLILAREFILTASYLMLTVFLWKNKLTRIFSIILIVLWLLNTSISLVIYSLFESHLNYQLAITILSTNFGEAIDFLLSCWEVVIVSLFLFVVLIIFIIYSSKSIPTSKFLIIIALILPLVVSYKFVEIVVKRKFAETNYLVSEKLLPYSSLYNLSVFSRAHNELNILKKVIDNKITNNLYFTETSIDIYVIVIGESARKDHFSLYDYFRKTTPYLVQQKPNLFVFENAIASAPITTMALSRALTKKTVVNTEITLLGDNIVNLANQAGYKTYWYSKQGSINGGRDDTVIAAIAHNAYQKDWIIEGYDDKLLFKLDEALAEKNTYKKLIVLHTNGSHSLACNKYPDNENYLKNGRSEYEDCYDNSILFTDKLLNSIYSKLENKNASVFYFSDHGQRMRIKRGQIDYVHSSINPTKESVQVPQFIWYSPALNMSAKKIGNYAEYYSTSDNYYLIADWLGIKEIDGKIVDSPLNDSYIPSNKILVIDSQLNLFNYTDLPADKDIN